jgi:hypothetical protein
VIGVLREQADQLHAGAIITIDEMTSRLRILPIQRSKSNPPHNGFGERRKPCRLFAV